MIIGYEYIDKITDKKAIPELLSHLNKFGIGQNILKLSMIAQSPKGVWRSTAPYSRCKLAIGHDPMLSVTVGGVQAFNTLFKFNVLTHMREVR